MRQFFLFFISSVLLQVCSLGVEILEAHPTQSGRLSGPEHEDASFGKTKWTGLHGFRLNDYLVGTVSGERSIEVSVVFGFEIEEPFLKELKKRKETFFLFTIAGEHEGDVKKIFPLEVTLLQRNAASAREAAEASLVKKIGSIEFSELATNEVYRMPVPIPNDLEVGDFIWIGLNAKNPLDGVNHNLIIGGDLTSFPGTVRPMLAAGESKALSETVQGISFLTSLNRKISSPPGPGDLAIPILSSPYLVNPFTIKDKINQLESIQRVLSSELDKLPVAKRQIREQQLGFHSSIKPLEESWKLTLPVNGIASALCLAPAVELIEEQLQPFAFPRRFSIKAYLPESQEGIVIADWSDRDFPKSRGSPVVFTFPWQYYDKIEFEIYGGLERGGEHFFALEEIFLYRPGDLDRTIIEIASGDTLEAEPRWGAHFLTDAKTSLGTMRSNQEHILQSEHIPFPNGLARPLEIEFSLRKVRPIWSLQIYPVVYRDRPEIPAPAFPRQMIIDLSTDAAFTKLVSSLAVLVPEDALPTEGNPLHFDFSTVKAKYVRIRIEELPLLDGIPQLGLSEIRINAGHSLHRSSVSLTGFPQGVVGRRFADDVANGCRLSEPLPWMINLVRRDIISEELATINQRVAGLLTARQRSIRLLSSLAVTALCFAIVTVYFWQRRKASTENLRVRRRIQQDLHDEIGSSLGTIALVSSHVLSRNPKSESQGELADINLCAREATASLREVIWLTDKSILTLDKCFGYMRIRAEQMVRDCELEVKTSPNPPAIPIASDLKRNLFLFFTEAIHNALRHSSPSLIRIDLRYQNCEMMIKVEDDGVGFDIASVTEGIGMKSMRARAEQVGSQMKISSQRGKGTTVDLRIKISHN